MKLIVRALTLSTAVAITQGCGSKQEEVPASSESTETATATEPSGVAGLLDACTIRTYAPETREWKTYWDPNADGLVRGGPSSAGSPYWANEEERQKIPRSGMGAAPPLDFTCTAEGQDGQTEIVVGLGAHGSTDQDVPFGPGTYPITGRFGGERKPGAFVANLVLGQELLDATSGTVNIVRFDSEGVAGSFQIEAKDVAGNNRVFKLEGTFDMPCRGGPLEGNCTANKANRG